MVETKTIRLSEDTKNELDTLGCKGESYEEIIKRTITFTKKFNNESDFTGWFKDNYELFGFTKILKQSTCRTPDFIMLKDGQEVNVELETIASNFKRHGHDPTTVDLVICLVKDVDLPVPILEIKAFEFAKKSIHLVYLNDTILQNINTIKQFFYNKYHITPSDNRIISAALEVYVKLLNSNETIDLAGTELQEMEEECEQKID